MDDVKAAGEAAIGAVKQVAGTAIETVGAVAAKAGVEAATPLPATRAELLALHRELRHRRDEAPLDSHERARAMADIGRVEVEVARLDRAMDPPRV